MKEILQKELRSIGFVRKEGTRGEIQVNGQSMSRQCREEDWSDLRGTSVLETE